MSQKRPVSFLVIFRGKIPLDIFHFMLNDAPIGVATSKNKNG